MNFIKSKFLILVLIFVSFSCNEKFITEEVTVNTVNIKLLPSSLNFNNNSLSVTLIIENVGDELIIWEIKNVPDWLILSDPYGEFKPFGELKKNESIAINCSVKTTGVSPGHYTDSLTILFATELKKIPCSLDLSCITIPNGVYLGPTSEGGSLSIEVENNILGCLEGEYFRMQADTILYTLNNTVCFYQSISFADSCWFHATEYISSIGNYWSISGHYDGDSTISGKWSHEYGTTDYSVKLQ